LPVYTGICSWRINYLCTSLISRLISSKWPFTGGDFLIPEGENVPRWSTRVASEIRNPYLALLIGRSHRYLAQGEGKNTSHKIQKKIRSFRRQRDTPQSKHLAYKIPE
jgi:hypothetical protein